MAISYPLTFPTYTGIRSLTLRQVTASKLTGSPFTFKQQAIVHTGQRWEADVSLPPLATLANGKQWAAWLSSLRGVQGTFLMGDPTGSAPRGAASLLGASLALDLGTGTYMASPSGGTGLVVDGANQTGGSLNVQADEGSVTGYLLAGDYIQLGSGSTTSLHMVLQDVDTAADGTATLDLWPDVRRATADQDPVVIDAPVGQWRLSANTTQWDINHARTYGIAFTAFEAIA